MAERHYDEFEAIQAVFPLVGVLLEPNWIQMEHMQTRPGKNPTLHKKRGIVQWPGRQHRAPGFTSFRFFRFLPSNTMQRNFNRTCSCTLRSFSSTAS